MRSLFEYFFSEDDTEETRHRKKLMVTLCLAITSVACGAAALNEFKLNILILYILGFYSVLLLLRWFITKKIPDRDIAVFLILWLAMVLFTDLFRVSEMGTPFWPAAVVLLDISLICKLPYSVTTSLVLAVCVHLVVTGIEQGTRFGLYDVVGSTKMRYIRGCFNITPEEIEATPCKVPLHLAGTDSMLFMSIFLLDYYATRSFAMGMFREKAKLQASVSLAETVVAALVRFDLEEAATCIGKEEYTPLSEVLSKLLQNLHQYRPYLPDSLFELSEESFNVTVSPPQDQAAILFTDLKSSTAIWEASPDAMKRALKMHNNIIRSCLGDYGGYEVKTIGDAFMVAFEDMTSGCSFAMAVQEKIMSTTWPTELVLPEHFSRNGWNGLVLRIGIHFGEVTTEVSELTGRTDYFGRTVNRAARIEGACTPGGIAISNSMLDQMPCARGWYHENISETLRGIDENPVEITLFHLNDARNRIHLSCDTFSVGSSMSFSTPGSPLSLVGKKGSATTCTVRLAIPDVHHAMHSIDNALSRAISCLERTEGSIIAVVSSFITIGWNTVRATPTHVENSVRFTSLMYSTFSSPGEIFIGLSSSPVHCGTVGTKEQRFVTVFGDCVAACGLLCQACYDIGAFALCTAETIKDFPVRPVDRWKLNTNGDEITTIDIYELNAPELKKYLCSPLLNDSLDNTAFTEWGWSKSYWTAFNNKDWETIKKQSTRSRVLICVADMLRSGSSLRCSF